MAEAVGLRVTRLVRIRLGPLTLGNLKPGEWRELRPAELAKLREAVGLATEEKDRA
jgi:16S rRNA U516 pseudouridylate synthase RsuA-like enzyme